MTLERDMERERVYFAQQLASYRSRCIVIESTRPMPCFNGRSRNPREQRDSHIIRFSNRRDIPVGHELLDERDARLRNTRDNSIYSRVRTRFVIL